MYHRIAHRIASHRSSIIISLGGAACREKQEGAKTVAKLSRDTKHDRECGGPIS